MPDPRLQAKYKKAASSLDPVKMREAQKYCMLYNDFDINLPRLSLPALPTPSSRCRATGSVSRCPLICADWCAFGFIVSKLGLQGLQRGSQATRRRADDGVHAGATQGYSNFDIENISRRFISSVHMWRVMYSTWCPCVLDADWCLRSDVVPNSRLLTPGFVVHEEKMDPAYGNFRHYFGPCIRHMPSPCHYTRCMPCSL